MIGQLYSYAEASQASEDRVRKLVSLGAPIVWDSGAWSVFNSGKTISLDDHASWVKARHAEYGADHVRFIGLDVIGDPAATLRNYRDQRSVGAPVEPTATFGASSEDLDDLIRVGDTRWINVGGLVKRDPKQIAAFLAFIKKRIPPEVKIHALGCTSPKVLGRVPVEGMDSSSWLTFAQFKRLILFRPHLGKWVSVNAGREDWTETHRAGGWLRDEYGIDPSDMFEPTTVPRTAFYLGKACEANLKFSEWVTKQSERRSTLYLASDRQGNPAYEFLHTVYLVGGNGNASAGFDWVADLHTKDNT
jgi:hypothetical protein